MSRAPVTGREEARDEQGLGGREGRFSRSGRARRFGRRGLVRVLPAELGWMVAVVGAVLVVAAAIPDYRAYEWTLWAVYGLLALSFTFVWGHGGIFSFGQAAFFGIGAYGFGAAAINISPHTGETVTALAAGAAAAALLAALLGYFIFYGNVGDVYVAIITLAVTLVLLIVMSSTASPKYHLGDALLGGYNGMIGIPPMMLGDPIGLSNKQMFVFTTLLVVGVALSIRLLLRRPFGRVLAGVRENELRTQLLGYDVRRHKLVAFVIGGATAGLAGALYAAWGLFVNPSVFTLSQAALVAIWVLVGGRSSLLGAFVGVVLVQGLSSTLGGSGGSWTPIVLGAAMIVIVLVLPSGVVPSLGRAWRAIRQRVWPGPPSPDRVGVENDGELARPREEYLQALMSARGPASAKGIRGTSLAKRFGGVQALTDVSLEVPAGSVGALIGPNGAGKSTCFNLLAGRYPPTAGRVWLGDEDVTRLRPDARARRGLGIKLQVASYYGELTVRENLWLAAYAMTRDVRRADEQTALALAWLGMEGKAELAAAELSHGEHQWLEIGMVVCGAPAVMLLDEPTAGMSRAETSRTVELIRAVGNHATVVVVEHDMEFLRQLDAPVTMFHQGALFATGSIEDLRRDDRVLDTYLGRGVRSDAER